MSALTLNPPSFYPNPFPLSRGYEGGRFDWDPYLQRISAPAAPVECFQKDRVRLSPKSKFKSDNDSEMVPLSFQNYAPLHQSWEVGSKVEAVDRSNASLVCAATVAAIMDGRVLIHFDGWDAEYDYWVGDEKKALRKICENEKI